MSPFDLMLRDLGELHVLSVIVVGLPLTSILLLVLGRRLAVLPLLISMGLGLVWFLYYAMDWPNPGIVAAWWAMLAVLAGWVTLGLAELWHRLRRSPCQPSRRGNAGTESDLPDDFWYSDMQPRLSEMDLGEGGTSWKPEVWPLPAGAVGRALIFQDLDPDVGGSLRVPSERSWVTGRDASGRIAASRRPSPSVA